MQDERQMALRTALKRGDGRGDAQVMERPAVAAPSKLAPEELVLQIQEVDDDVLKMHTGSHHVELTTATPHVEGRGHLNFLLARGVFCDEDSSAWWLAHDAKKAGVDGNVEIWLDGLEDGEAYIGQVRVGAIVWEDGPDEFEIATSYGSHFSVKAQPGLGQTIPLFIAENIGGMALTRIEAPGIDWIFFGVDVHKI